MHVPCSSATRKHDYFRSTVLFLQGFFSPFSDTSPTAGKVSILNRNSGLVIAREMGNNALNFSFLVVVESLAS